MKQTDKASSLADSSDSGARTAVLDGAASDKAASEAGGSEISSALLGPKHLRISPTLQGATDRYRLARPVLEI